MILIWPTHFLSLLSHKHTSLVSFPDRIVTWSQSGKRGGGNFIRASPLLRIFFNVNKIGKTARFPFHAYFYPLCMKFIAWGKKKQKKLRPVSSWTLHVHRQSVKVYWVSSSNTEIITFPYDKNFETFQKGCNQREAFRMQIMCTWSNE